MGTETDLSDAGVVRSRASSLSSINTSVCDSEYYSDAAVSETFSLETLTPSATNYLSYVLDKTLLLLPLAVSIFIRSVVSTEFRAMAIAWLLIIPMTTDVTLDEGVFPALVLSSLGYENRVVELNMFLPIARSRLGLFTMALIAFYSENLNFFVYGILQRSLISFASTLLDNSIPKSELSLICCALSNAVYYLYYSNQRTLWNDPTAIIICGLVAALPCYPLLTCFCKVYRSSRGKDHKNQNRLAACIYAIYFLSGATLYFGLMLHSASELWYEIVNNCDLILRWLLILTVAIAVAYQFGPRLGLDGRRKLWHVTTVMMFLPTSVRERPFTKLALGVAIVIFVGLEVIRAVALPPIGEPLHNALQGFVDHRDRRGPVIISHIYLLLGIAVPIFLKQSAAGLICLGLGDTFASQVGRRFGKWRVFGQKSLEGCIAFTFAASIAMYYTSDTPNILCVVIPTALLEAVTPLNDNLVVPMYMLALQGLVTPSWNPDGTL